MDTGDWMIFEARMIAGAPRIEGRTGEKSKIMKELDKLVPKFAEAKFTERDNAVMSASGLKKEQQNFLAWHLAMLNKEPEFKRDPLSIGRLVATIHYISNNQNEVEDSIERFKKPWGGSYSYGVKMSRIHRVYEMLFEGPTASHPVMVMRNNMEIRDSIEKNWGKLEPILKRQGEI